MNGEISIFGKLITQRLLRWHGLISVLFIGLLWPLSASAQSLLNSLEDFEKADSGTGELSVIVVLETPNRPATADGWLNLENYISAAQDAAIAELGWRNFNDLVRYESVPAMAKTVDRNEMRDLLSSTSVAGVFRDEHHPLLLRESNQLIERPVAGSAQASAGAGQVIAVLDTGIDSTHSFLQDKVVGEACFSQFGTCPGGGKRVEGKGAGQPCRGACSHGTHVGGIVAGSGKDFSGVAPGAKLLSVQVFSIDGKRMFATDRDILLGLDWVLKQRKRHNVAAVNLSLGGGAYRSTCDTQLPYRIMFAALREAGIMPVVAAGNESKTNAIAKPACLSNALSVGSLEKNGSVSSFSNSYGALSIMAPGGKILSAVPGNSAFAAKSGTSMAAPHVAGAWAVLRAAQPKATLVQLEQALLKNNRQYRDPRNGRTFAQLALTPALGVLEKLLKPEATPAPPSPAPVKPMPKPKPEPKPEVKPKPEPNPSPTPTPVKPQPPKPAPPAPEPRPKKEERIDGILIERSREGSEIEW